MSDSLFCRICLRNDSELRSVYDPDSGDNVAYVTKLITCVPEVMVDDADMPTALCDNCIEELRLAFHFHTKCTDSYNVFKDQLQMAATTQLDIVTLDATSNMLLTPTDGVEIETGTDLNYPEISIPSPLFSHLDLNDTNDIVLCDCQNIDNVIEGTSPNRSVTVKRRDRNVIRVVWPLIDVSKRQLYYNAIYRRMNRPHFQCHLCTTFCTATKRHLTLHMRHQHLLTFKPLSCDWCDFRCGWLATLERHKLRHFYTDPKLCRVEKRKFAALAFDRRHKCLICAMTFVTSKRLKRHLCVIHDGGRRQFDRLTAVNRYVRKMYIKTYLRQSNDSSYPKCPICDRIFFTIYVLRQHLCDEHNVGDAQAHPSKPPHKCDICQEWFLNAEEWEAHHVIHADKYKCNECDATYNFPSLLQRHYESQHCGEKRYECQVCGKKFVHRKQLTTHSNEHNGRKPYKCRKCPRRFPNGMALSQHSRIHVNGVKCAYCQKSFRRRCHLTTHEQRHLNICRNRCELCGRNCKSPNDLSDHMLKHSGKRTHNCPHCDRTFFYRTTLLQHQKLHGKLTSDVKLHMCQICGEEFRIRDDMLRHKRQCHPSSTHKCDICDKQLSSIQSYQLHLQLHSDILPYKCQQCPKAFNRTHALTLHMRTHTDQTSVECDVCGKNFRSKNTLRLHMQTHATIKAYTCPVCVKQFAQQNCLKTHIRKVHRNTGVTVDLICADQLGQ